jgi:hypothetical protein
LSDKKLTEFRTEFSHRKY